LRVALKEQAFPVTAQATAVLDFAASMERAKRHPVEVAGQTPAREMLVSLCAKQLTGVSSFFTTLTTS
tara:strand:+ start:518 stop:721 length:204 start_codon:yes stop_codon:yes gene_type:complete